MSKVAIKLRRAAMGGYDGSTGDVMENAQRLFNCDGLPYYMLLYRIAEAIEAEQGQCKEAEGVTESFDVPRDCEFVTVHLFHAQCSDKEQVCKVIEEAAEVFAAWQKCDECEGGARWCKECRKGVRFDGCPYEELSDEIADVIQAACNLAYRYGIDIAAAMQLCEERNRERGRYGAN